MFGFSANIFSALVAVGLTTVLQIHEGAAAPLGRVDNVGQKDVHSENPIPRMYKRSEEITVIFTSSCSGHGPYEFSIAREKTGCINVGKPTPQQIIKTNPDGARLRIFDAPDCQGNSKLYTPPGFTSNGESSQFKLPFEVSSFTISRSQEDGQE
ncbi:unnamed protein product [Orchesella dallaii]|uniref:Uncharacterized protein n=1 Tax=Orchesella dallaii TaxID=48710 RepID=A0ABP1QSY0_9HEXA